MILGKVTDSIEVSARHPSLEGAAFLLVQPQEGGAVVAADLLSAPLGSEVLLCQGAAAQALLGCACPADAAVAAVVRSCAHRPE